MLQQIVLVQRVQVLAQLVGGRSQFAVEVERELLTVLLANDQILVPDVLQIVVHLLGQVVAVLVHLTQDRVHLLGEHFVHLVVERVAVLLQALLQLSNGVVGRANLCDELVVLLLTIMLYALVQQPMNGLQIVDQLGELLEEAGIAQFALIERDHLVQTDQIVLFDVHDLRVQFVQQLLSSLPQVPDVLVDRSKSSFFIGLLGVEFLNPASDSDLEFADLAVYLLHFGGFWWCYGRRSRDLESCDGL